MGQIKPVSSDGGRKSVMEEVRITERAQSCSCMCAHSLQLCLTLCDPTTVARQAPLSMGFSRQEHWSGFLCPPPGDLPNPGIEPESPALQVSFLSPEPPGKPRVAQWPLLQSVLWFKESLLARKDFLQPSEDMDSHVAGPGLQIPCSWLCCWWLFHLGTGIQPQKCWELPHFGWAREQNSGLLDWPCGGLCSFAPWVYHPSGLISPPWMAHTQGWSKEEIYHLQHLCQLSFR